MGSCAKDNMQNQMTATEDSSKVTAILLIQPASYLQCGLAAYPAKLSFRPGVSPEGRLLLSTQQADAEGEKNRSSNLSDICTQQL